jgi:hypothetical protein
MRRRMIFIIGTIAGSMVTPIGTAGAQTPDNNVLAEQLFVQGRELAKNNKWAEACPKFEASLRYDAALGTRLNLANCYEHIGKLASAWGLYRDSADLASRAGDIKRRDYALKHAAALLPRLPRLTIMRPATTPPGFAVSRNGVTIDLAVLGSTMYVDPGPHEVTAKAPGFEPFRTSITIAEARSETIAVPDLMPSEAPRVKEAHAESPQPRSQPLAERLKSTATPARPPDRRRIRKYIAFGAGATGAALIGAGLFLGARASSSYDEAKAVCGNLICETDADFARGQDLIARARTEAAFSTALVATGAAALGTGVALWLTAPRRSRTETARISPVITHRDVGVALSGRF